jgi:hypothetical protein
MKTGLCPFESCSLGHVLLGGVAGAVPASVGLVLLFGFAAYELLHSSSSDKQIGALAEFAGGFAATYFVKEKLTR